MTRHPLHPYAWEAQYTDGRRLRWESPGGPWSEARVPVAGLRRLVALGHPAGPIGYTLPSGMAPEAAYLRMRGILKLGRQPSHRRRWFFGVRLPGWQIHGVRLDDRGHASLYHGPEGAW